VVFTAFSKTQWHPGELGGAKDKRGFRISYPGYRHSACYSDLRHQRLLFGQAPLEDKIGFFYYLAACMKTFFEIIPESFYEEDCALICELSEEGVSFCIKDVKEHKFIGAAVYNFDKSRPSAGFHIALKILFNTKPFLSRNYQKVTVVYSIPESTLIPFQLFDSTTASNALNLLFGNLSSDFLEVTDIITESGYYNCFRIRNDIQRVVDEQFPNRVSWHQYSLLLGRNPSGKSNMYVIFYSYKMVVSLFVNGKCRLINTYRYQIAEDVSYYLLALRQQNKVENIPVEVSGFIEKDSSLYTELYKYFQDITFAPLPSFCEYGESLSQYPAHYFSHLFELDPCG
jgi:hypothetical protein